MLLFSPSLDLRSFSLLFPHNSVINPKFCSYPYSNLLLSSSSSKCDYKYRNLALSAISKANSEHKPDPNPDSIPETEKNDDENQGTVFPTIIPKKPRRGRKSEASAVEDFIRNSLEKTFTSIRQQNSEILNDKDSIMKEKPVNEVESDETDDKDENEEKDEESGDKKGNKMVVEEENTDWPLDADVGWGIRASEYFEQHAIKNVVGKDGVEIDWEGELDDNLVKEINCLEWEEFAFHPSPLIVLIFERYNRPSENWKCLKELEEAAKVYWRAKDRLPPRTVKVDINIERDLAYALKIRECPQILFLKGNRILYREKQLRTSEELVQMIAHFYYKARKPSWMTKEAPSSS